MSRAEQAKKVDEMLEMVGIPAARKREYPHQFSGGMKQRVEMCIRDRARPDRAAGCSGQTRGLPQAETPVTPQARHTSR